MGMLLFSYKRISIEGFGCSINLNRIGVMTTEVFMGCGFCSSPPITKPELNAKPCSVCNYFSSKTEVIRTGCDYQYRSLCVGMCGRLAYCIK